MHGMPPVTADIRQQLRDMVLLSLRTADWSSHSAGLVVAGFDNDQIFPSVSHWLVDQVMDNVVKSRVIEDIEIDDDQTSVILPFAQQYEVTRTVIDGIHPEFLETHHVVVRTLLDMLARTVLDRVVTVVPKRLASEMREYILDLPDQMLRVIPDRLDSMVTEYSLPILEIIGGLPKEHLAEMAEMLVALASFKEQFTPGADIVGGPIDVAVISRSDGLVWVKHKQYFDHEFGSQASGLHMGSKK